MLLETLMRHSGRVLSHEQLLSHVWGYSYDPTTNLVNVYIGSLRKARRRRDPNSPRLRLPPAGALTRARRASRSVRKNRRARLDSQIADYRQSS